MSNDVDISNGCCIIQCTEKSGVSGGLNVLWKSSGSSLSPAEPGSAQQKVTWYLSYLDTIPRPPLSPAVALDQWEAEDPGPGTNERPAEPAPEAGIISFCHGSQIVRSDTIRVLGWCVCVWGCFSSGEIMGGEGDIRGTAGSQRCTT